MFFKVPAEECKIGSPRSKTSAAQMVIVFHLSSEFLSKIVNQSIQIDFLLKKILIAVCSVLGL